MTITGNGTSTIDIIPGQEYSLGAAGTWDSGSLAISWTDASGNTVAFDDSPLTANGGFIFSAPSGTLTLVMSSVASACSVKVSLANLN
jgi:hypothetical protein